MAGLNMYNILQGFCKCTFGRIMHAGFDYTSTSSHFLYNFPTLFPDALKKLCLEELLLSEANGRKRDEVGREKKNL